MILKVARDFKEIYQSPTLFIIQKPIEALVYSIAIKALAFYLKSFFYYPSVALLVLSTGFEWSILTNAHNYSISLKEKVNNIFQKISMGISSFEKNFSTADKIFCLEMKIFKTIIYLSFLPVKIAFQIVIFPVKITTEFFLFSMRVQRVFEPNN